MDHFGINLHVLSGEIGCYEDNHSGVSDMSREMEDGTDLTDFITPMNKTNMGRVTQERVTWENQYEANTDVDACDYVPDVDEDDNVSDVDVKTRFKGNVL